LAGSIRKVLPVLLITPGDLFSGAGGFAAAIAIGAFIGQALDTLRPVSELRRRRFTAVGGFIGFLAFFGLIFLSANGW
jgi:hypothetical protein